MAREPSCPELRGLEGGASFPSSSILNGKAVYCENNVSVGGSCRTLSFRKRSLDMDEEDFDFLGLSMVSSRDGEERDRLSLEGASLSPLLSDLRDFDDDDEDDGDGGR